MARTTVIKLVDDLDQSDAAETVHFAVDGIRYEIDLSEVNAKELREVFAPYVEAGRKATAAGTRVPSARAAGKVENGKIREWARKNGREIGDRGRIPAELAAAYRAAA